MYSPAKKFHEGLFDSLWRACFRGNTSIVQTCNHYAKTTVIMDRAWVSENVNTELRHLKSDFQIHAIYSVISIWGLFFSVYGRKDKIGPIPIRAGR